MSLKGPSYGIAANVLAAGGLVITQATQYVPITPQAKELQNGTYVIPGTTNLIRFGGTIEALADPADILTDPIWYLSQDTDILTLSRPAYIRAESDTTQLTLFTPTDGSPNQWNRATAATTADAGGLRNITIPNWVRKLSTYTRAAGVWSFRSYDPAPSTVILTGLDAGSPILLTAHFQW